MGSKIWNVELAAGVVASDARRIDLRARAGRAESRAVRHPPFSGVARAMITFELDDRRVEAAPGETIWQVARREGD